MSKKDSKKEIPKTNEDIREFKKKLGSLIDALGELSIALEKSERLNSYERTEYTTNPKKYN